MAAAAAALGVGAVDDADVVSLRRMSVIMNLGRLGAVDVGVDDGGVVAGLPAGGFVVVFD